MRIEKPIGKYSEDQAKKKLEKSNSHLSNFVYFSFIDGT